MSNVATQRIAFDMKTQQINFRASRALREALNEEAKKEGRKLSNFVEFYLRKLIEERRGCPLDESEEEGEE